MKIERETIEAHARRRLQAEGAGAGPLAHFKRFLKLETDRLRMRHRFGLGGLEIATARSHQVRGRARRAGRPGRLRGGGPRGLRPGRARALLRRRPAVPAPGPRPGRRPRVRRARAAAPVGHRPRRRPQLPDGGRVPRRGPGRPSLAHRARRGAARGRRHGGVHRARPLARPDDPARSSQRRGVRGVPAAGRGRASRPLRRSRVRSGAERQGGRRRAARPARGPVGGPGAPGGPGPRRGPGRGDAVGAGAP